MRRKFQVAGLVAICGFAIPAYAQDLLTAYVFSEGTKSCGEYLKAVEGEQKSRPAHTPDNSIYSNEYLAFAAYADGYLTGENVWLHTSTGQGTDLFGRLSWLETYCRQNPLTSYVNALAALRLHLVAHQQ
jgi:hypothetical protein